MRAALPLLALLSWPAACGDPAAGAELEPGHALFIEARCNSCHGRDGEGFFRMGPELARLAENWTRDELVAYIADPAPFRSSKPHLEELSRGYFNHMRAFPELSRAGRETLADWLLSRP